MDHKMSTRREFCRTAAGAIAASIASPIVAAHQTAPPPPVAKKMPTAYHQDKSLLQLQQEFVDLRFGMFLHFNMATFQDREWGDPNGPTEAFDPSDLDTDQWARAAVAAGMKFGCLTTKHHDGFCIWPTKTNVASILQTPKKLDVVRAYCDSFRKHGLKVGLYYSILDLRNDIRHHNITPEKIQLMKDQITELLTHYGEIAFLIFDGWDAPWSRIPYSEVPFHEIYELVKRLQPNCLISELNASEYPASGLYYTDIKAFEQNAGQALPDDSIVPAQSCVTLTDGWFWKERDKNARLKSVKQVVEEWLVPQNERFCALICNAAPNREGQLAPNLVHRLEEIGQAWKHGGPVGRLKESVVITTPNMATGKPIHASSYPDTVGPDLCNDGHFGSGWYPVNDDAEPWLEIDFGALTAINVVSLVEPVGKFGDYQRSRIQAYRFQGFDGSKWVDLASGGTPARVQFHAIPEARVSKLRFTFRSVAGGNAAHIAEIGAYREPTRSKLSGIFDETSDFRPGTTTS